MKKVEIYSTPTCTYCNLAKDFFKKNNVPYTEYNVATDMAKRAEMVDLTGQMGVPVIVIGDEVTVGFSKDHIAQSLGLK